MKVKTLIEILESLDGDSDVFVKRDPSRVEAHLLQVVEAETAWEQDEDGDKALKSETVVLY